MTDSSWYSDYYKNKNKGASYKEETKPKKPLLSPEKQVKLTKEFIQEVAKTNPPKPSASRYLDYRKKEIQKIEQAGEYIEKPSSESAQNIITPPKKPDFKPLYSKPYYPSYTKYPKIEAEPIEEKQPKPDSSIVINEVKKKIEKESGKAWNFTIEPKHIRILKILIILIPILIIGYLLIVNFVIAKEFNYSYDIGGNQDSIKPYLSPLNRISDVSNTTETYRNLTSNLVYFSSQIPKNSQKVKIQVRFQDNIHDNYAVSIGAQDQDVWHYKWNTIYNSYLKLSEFNKLDNIYLINKNLSLMNISELYNHDNVVIATDLPYTPWPNIIDDYNDTITTINTSLRGGHTFYAYLSDDLDLKVKKQDINWYNGSDELQISVYDDEDNLIANTTIPDDGITNVSKTIALIQSGELTANDLFEGVYRIEFTDFDGLIREIQINTNKIVADNLFLADNSLYSNITTAPSKFYINVTHSSQLTFLTYHSTGLQNITYNKNSFQIKEINKPSYLHLTPGDYEFTLPQNDMIVSYPGYFAFSRDNYFEPFLQRVIPIPNSIDLIKENADYLITNYTPPNKQGDWITAETEFNIKQDKLFVNNNKLSLVFNIPGLGSEARSNQTIPLDWINITVYKPGMF